MYSSGGGIKIVDYRNGQYEGEFREGRREGLGMLIDDDMNIWVGEWRNNKIDGLCFIHMRNGEYLYGEWKMNLPHGTIMVREK